MTKFAGALIVLAFVVPATAKTVEKTTYNYRVAKPWTLKAQPWWWFGNTDEPAPPSSYQATWPGWARYVGWYLRNPLHNGNYYIWGWADRNYVSYERLPQTGKCVHYVLVSGKARRPFVTCNGGWYLYYAGWQQPGYFGVKFNILGSPFQVY